MKQHHLSYSDQISRLYPATIASDETNKIQCPNVTFQVTDACNLCCTYCYQINKSTHIMPLHVAQQFIDILLENNKDTQQYLDTRACDAVIIDFIGGEPLL